MRNDKLLTEIKKISIIGDSFSSDDVDDTSWISLLSKQYCITNYSQRGISQYRLYKHLVCNLKEIEQSDAVIIFHTNPDRVYIPDGVSFPSRLLDSHPYCDLVANDSLEKKDWKNIAENFYRYFYDQEQQNLYYQLLVERMIKLLDTHKVIHCSGFDTLPNIKSFLQLQQQYPGTVNHCSALGNYKIYNYLAGELTNEHI